MFYLKKIISYFDYYEYGEKKRSCGYSRLLVRDQETTIEVHIKGLGIRENAVCRIYTEGKRRISLGRFVLDKGTGCYSACFHSMDMDGSGYSVFEAAGLFVHINEDKHCKTAWDWGKLPDEIRIRVEDGAGMRADGEGEKPEEPEEGAQQELDRTEPEEGAQQELDRTEPEEGGQQAADRTEPEDMLLHKSQLTAEAAQNGGRQDGTLQETLYEDKWQQLCSQYPVCHPFEDGQAYISIAPRDFVILRKEYQNLVSNSFLLHSFYNYHHIILGKTGQDDMYYIGAPGAYLEREKKVAVMFGFDGFARSARTNDTSVTKGSGRTAAAPGAFGYYMRKVEI